MRALRLDWITAAGLGFLGTVASAEAASVQSWTRSEITKAADERPDASVPRQGALDPARVITDQMHREKHGDMTGLLSKSFKAAYDAVPRDEDNLGVTILGGGYDVPQHVVRVSDLGYDDAVNPAKASATVTLHYTNEDAPVPSFDRSLVIVFVKEDSRWTIDDVHMLDPQGHRSGREIGLKAAFESLRRAKSAARRGGRQPNVSQTRN